VDAAEASAFDVFITTDKNLRYQQNLTGRRIAILVLWTTNWLEISPYQSAAPSTGSFAGRKRRAGDGSQKQRG
jgi:hypothetical protein